jgi:Tol biopolymer transport system component
MYLAGQDGKFQLAGAYGKIEFTDGFYIGLGVCSHEKDISETAVFSNVNLITDLPSPDDGTKLFSTLETVTVASTDRRVVYVTPGRIEAPNWTPDGLTLVFNQDGRIYRMPAVGGSPVMIDTGFADRCNNDHGISFDGKRLAISDQSAESHHSIIYTVPIDGGTPTRITQQSPSYFHGWSPDGKTLAFCGQRDGKFGIFTIPSTGGEETRITTTSGLDDGPEFSPDGKYIYFNSDRTGLMQIYRMRPDGSELQQIISDVSNNWFPHLSPDGTRMAFLTFDKDVKGHPPDKDVTVRMMTLKDGKITVLAKLLGGQGTINVSSWSPDGLKLAFVSYEQIPPATP